LPLFKPCDRAQAWCNDGEAGVIEWADPKRGEKGYAQIGPSAAEKAARGNDN